MAQYIDKSALVAEIERRMKKLTHTMSKFYYASNYNEWESVVNEYKSLMSFLDTLEVKEVDLEKFGEIARHLIAVKEHIEDMRLDKEEWFMLERIGYPERFRAKQS